MPDPIKPLGPKQPKPKAGASTHVQVAFAEGREPKAPSPQMVSSFATLFGQRYQATKFSESDTLARLAGAALLRLPNADPEGILARQVAAGRLNEDGIRRLQQALNASGAKLNLDGQYGPRTHAALAKALKSQAHAPNGPQSEKKGLTPKPLQAKITQPKQLVETAKVLALGSSLDGHHLKRSSGRATTFANGHIAYKGWVDTHNKQNRGLGAWGDKCAPTEYFCALPDALGLSVSAAKWWHNKKILVTNPENGKQVVVRIQDKGPHGKTGAAIDLSPVATEALGGALGGSISRVTFQFANQDAPVGPVR